MEDKMKIAIIYYSGTGSTFRVAERFKELLNEKECEVDLFDVTKDFLTIKQYDLIILGSPTYSKVASIKLIEYVDHYVFKSNNEESKVITYVTHSWGETYGHIQLAKDLGKRDFEIAASIDLLLPNNHYMMTGKKHSNSEMKTMYTTLNEKLKLTVNTVLNNEKVYKTKSSLKRVIFKKMYSMLRKKWIPNYAKNYLSVDAEKCTQCNVCVSLCPNKNIKLNRVIDFDTNCSACVKCFNSCPSNAYKVQGKEVDRFTVNNRSIISNINSL